MIIDCVFDDSIADELAQYLRKNGHAVTTENSIITTRDDARQDLESFVIETDRNDYSICTFEDALILSRKMPAEEMGIRVCKQCGFLASSDRELEHHQNSHSPCNWTYYHR